MASTVKKDASTSGASAPAKAKAKTPRKRAASTKRKPAAPPDRPRRAIFVDVENTSSESDLVRVLESLQVDYKVQPTEITAVGNWRAAGQRIARRLASMGARLVHSAPVTGVRDWSDLWIATAAGCWLGRATPGDALEIVSDDRAFDAVGDLALHLGVTFRRVSHRSAGAARSSAREVEPGERRGRGSRRRRGRRKTGGAPAEASLVEAHPEPQEAPGEGHPAPPDALEELMAELSAGRAGGWVNLDVLEGALKARGFARPPGSPRLVTRLRKLKDFEVSAHGKVRLVGGAS